MEAKLNENGKINLYLGRDMGCNLVKVGEFDTLSELKREGKKLLKNRVKCGNNLPAREYAYISNNGYFIYSW